MKRLFCFTLLIITLGSMRLPAQDFGADSTEVLVLPVKMSLPSSLTLLGHIKAGNNSTELHCDYEAVIDEAKRKAKAMGGNLVKITELRSPVFISGCYGIKADVYLFPYINRLVYQVKPEDKSPVIHDSDKYALLYMYRLKDTVFPSARYTVYKDSNNAIFRSKSKNTVVVKLDKEQKIIIWAKAGKRKEITLNIKHGGIYYIRCGVEHGNVLQNPVLEVVSEETGRKEYNMLNKGKVREKNVGYLNQIH